MAESGMGIIKSDSLFINIKNRKIWAKFYRILMFELITYSHSKILVL